MNLKKVLSLVLCVAMMLSVMVVGAGAAFSDQSKIKNTEAVDACTALNIIGGYPDGSFKPEGNITRAEVTKMICVALNGGKNPAVSTNTTPTFSDVRNNANAAWAEGYIESCAAQGIVSGVGGGKFAPNGNVTGVQLAKMLLVSLGYKSENEGFTGNAWATNVNVRAAQKGLYAGLEKMDTSAAITRDNAAQMVWNALNAYEVEYKTTLTTDSKGQLTSQITVQDKVDGNFQKITLMEDKYEADTFIGTFEGNADSLGLDDGMIQVYGVTGVESDKNPKVEATFKSTLDLKYIGEEVKVLYKDETGGTAGQPDKKDTIYGVYVTGETKVINTTRDGIDEKSDGKKVKIDGTKYEVAAVDAKDSSTKTTYAVMNLGAASDLTVTGDKTADQMATTFATLNAQSGSPVKFVCNSNGKIVKAYVMDSTINKVNAATSSKVTLNTIGGLEKEDNYIYDKAAKDDIVVATKQFDDVKYTVAKAETVTGELKGFVTEKINQADTTTKVTIDGKTYKVADKSLKNLSDDCVTKVEDSDIGSEVTAYMLNGMVGALEVKESSSTWAVVSGFNGKYGLETSFNAAEVELTTADGKTISGKVHKDSEYAKGNTFKATGYVSGNSGKTNQEANLDKLTKGALVKYVQTSDNVIKIKEVSTKSVSLAAQDKIYDKDTKSLTTSKNEGTLHGTVVASDATAYITNSDGDIKAYTLRDLKSITASTATTVNYVTDDGKVIAAYINLSARPTGSAADTVYGEITEVNGTKKVDGDYYNEYVVTCNDKTYTVYTNQTGLQKKQIVSFDPTSDNIYDTGDIDVYSGKMDATKAKAVWVKEYDAAQTLTYYTEAPTKQDQVYVGNEDKLTTDAVDDDVIVTYVDLKDSDNAGENIGVNEFSATTGHANAIVVYDTDGKTIVAIFVETSDEVNMATIVTNS